MILARWRLSVLEILLMSRRTVDLGLLLLPAKNIEQNSRAKRMADEADLALKIWIPFTEEIENAIRLLENNRANVFPIRTLIEQNIQSCKCVNKCYFCSGLLSHLSL